MKNQIENVTKLFIEAHSEFVKTKKSEKSVESLFDLVYLMMEKETTEEDNYILSKLYFY